MIIDNLTCKMQDYLRTNYLHYTLTKNHLIIDMQGMTIAFIIYDKQITVHTSPDLSLAYEPFIKKFEIVKIKLQSFILDNKNEINELINDVNQNKLIGDVE